MRRKPQKFRIIRILGKNPGQPGLTEEPESQKEGRISEKKTRKAAQGESQAEARGEARQRRAGREPSPHGRFEALESRGRGGLKERKSAGLKGFLGRAVRAESLMPSSFHQAPTPGPILLSSFKRPFQDAFRRSPRNPDGKALEGFFERTLALGG